MCVLPVLPGVRVRDCGLGSVTASARMGDMEIRPAPGAEIHHVAELGERGEHPPGADIHEMDWVNVTGAAEEDATVAAEVEFGMDLCTERIGDRVTGDL